MSRNSVEDYVLRNITKLHAQSGKMFEDATIPFMPDKVQLGDKCTVYVRDCRGTEQDRLWGTDVMTYIVNDQGQVRRTRWDITERGLDDKTYTTLLAEKKAVLRSTDGTRVGSVDFGLRHANGRGKDRQFHERVVVVSVCAEHGLDITRNSDDLMTVARAFNRAWMRIMLAFSQYGVLEQLSIAQPSPS